MIEKYLSKKYINNYSEIMSFSNDDAFIEILNSLNENIYIDVSSNLIHKDCKINQIEQFIFNMDNYITYIKGNIFINNFELRYIINLTLYNKYSKVLYSDKYYYNNINYYTGNFKKMFMHQYLLNCKKLNIKPMSFNTLISFMNSNKKRINCLFEKITNDNLFFYSTIINNLLNKNIKH